MALWDLLRNIGNKGGGMAAASNAGASSSGGGGNAFSSLLSAFGGNNQSANTEDGAEASNLFSNLMSAFNGNKQNTDDNSPKLPSIQLNEDGNIDKLKSETVDLANQQKGKPLTLSDRLFGREMTKDIQTINPETGEATLQTITNYRPGFLTDLNAGMNENYNNDFNVNNLGNKIGTDGRPKGAAYRIGEGLGSLARGLATWGGDAWTAGYNGLDAGLQRQAVRTGDQLYRQQLKDNYGYTDADLNNIKGFISRNDFNTLANNSFKNKKLDQTTYVRMVKELDTLHKTNQISDDVYLDALGKLNLQYANSNTYNISDIGASNDTKKTDSQVKLNEAKTENIKNPKPKVNITYKYGTSNVNFNHNGGGKVDKGKTNNNFSADLAEFNQIMATGDAGKTEYARNTFIKKHGKDPKRLIAK